MKVSQIFVVTGGKCVYCEQFVLFRHVCHKWHYKIAKALVVCLESKDFVQIRNSLIVLTKIIQHFPVIQNLATVIEKRVEKVQSTRSEILNR